MSGWYLMHRGWQDSAVFKDEPYTEREAWEWLISEATYEDQVVNIMNNPVRLDRGQVSHSVRFLADKWHWTKSQVETYLNKLKKWDMVRTENRTGQNIITICNYSQYQNMQTENRTAPTENVGQSSDSHRTKKNKDNEDKERIPPTPRGEPVVIPDCIPVEAWEAWKKYKGQKFTLSAQKLSVGKLTEWAERGYSPREIINTSIMNGWKGLFEPKEKTHAKPAHKPNSAEHVKSILDAAEAEIHAAQDAGRAEFQRDETLREGCNEPAGHTETVRHDHAALQHRGHNGGLRRVGEDWSGRPGSGEHHQADRGSEAPAEVSTARTQALLRQARDDTGSGSERESFQRV